MSNYQTYQAQPNPPKKPFNPFCLIAGILGCLGLIVLTIGGLATLAYLTPSFTKGLGDGFVDTQLDKISSDLNKTLPQMVDSITKLESTRTRHPRTLIYHYMLLKDADSMNPTVFTERMKAQILQKYKTDDDLKFFRDNKVILIYEYDDQHDVHFVDVQVGPDDLSGP